MQKLNLYAVYLAKKPKKIDTKAVWSIAIGICAVFIAWIGLTIGQYYQLLTLKENQRRHLTELKTQVATLEEKVIQINLDQLTGEIDALISQLSTRQATLQGLLFSADMLSVESINYANYFEALARVRTPGTQITGFGIAKNGSEFTIEGISTDPKYVSELVGNVAQDNGFKGKPFNHFKVRATDPKATKYHFVLATQEKLTTIQQIEKNAENAGEVQ